MIDSPERLATRYLRQIGTMARSIVKLRFVDDGIDGYLDFQEKLATLQRDVQKNISNYKERVRREPELRRGLNEMREVRWHARRLGDAFAWSMLLQRRRVIFPLTQNRRIPLSPSGEDDGTIGMFRMARALTSPEWGLPVIHDLTDCLRIGDITFVRFGESPEEHSFRTVEVKTRRLSALPLDDGTTDVRLQIQVVAVDDMPEIPQHLARGPEEDDLPDLLPPGREDRRLRKQMERMHDAREHRDAPSNAISKLGGASHISLELDDEADPHWKELRRCIRLARRDGYAFFSPDGMTGYALFYGSDGAKTGPWLEQFGADIQSTLFPSVPTLRDSLTVSQIPIAEDDAYAEYILPFFLYDIPQRAIEDLLTGRLAISAVSNTGRLEEALAQAGFEIVPVNSGPDHRPFLARTVLHWPDGRTLGIDAPMAWRDIYTAVHEFRGMASVVNRMKAVRDMPGHIAFEDFEFEMHGEAGASAYHEQERP